jgi:hypothetical protein
VLHYRCQRFNSNQSKEQVRSQKKGAKRKPKAALVWRTGQCPVHQGASAQTLHLRVSQAQLRYNSLDCPVHYRTVSGALPDCPVHHRTVRCTSGTTAICAQWTTLTDEQYSGRSQSSGQRGIELSGATPDCPVPHEDKVSNGRPAQRPNGRVTWRRTGHFSVAHRTVRCAHRQQPSPTATIWLVAINTTLTGHFKGWEPKQHSKSSS